MPLTIVFYSTVGGFQGGVERFVFQSAQVCRLPASNAAASLIFLAATLTCFERRSLRLTMALRPYRTAVPGQTGCGCTNAATAGRPLR